MNSAQRPSKSATDSAPRRSGRPTRRSPRARGRPRTPALAALAIAGSRFAESNRSAAPAFPAGRERRAAWSCCRTGVAGAARAPCLPRPQWSESSHSSVKFRKGHGVRLHASRCRDVQAGFRFPFRSPGAQPRPSAIRVAGCGSQPRTRRPMRRAAPGRRANLRRGCGRGPSRPADRPAAPATGRAAR